MLNENGDVLRTVAWPDICPWLGIFRTFRIAVGGRVLLLGAVAILLTGVVWGVFAALLATDSQATNWASEYAKCSWLAITSPVDGSSALPTPADLNPINPQANPMLGAWMQLTQPLWGVFGGDATVRDLACLLLCGLSSLAIWAFFGGAITRIAAVQLACGERVSLASAMRHACSKWLAYFVAPLIPLLGVAFAAIPVLILGLMMNANVGVLLAALVWPLALIAGLVMAMLLLGLIFGWPLMWATISTEGTDSFDALSRSYAYVYQRPLHYLFYVVVASVFGMLGWLLVSNFAAAVINLAYWAASFGCGAEQMANVMPGGETTLTGVGYAGAVLIRFWAGCVKLLAVGFIYGYFWTAAGAIYLLLRRDADATEMDEVYLDEDASEQTYGLPPLDTDEEGAPIAVDDQPEEE